MQHWRLIVVVSLMGFAACREDPPATFGGGGEDAGRFCRQLITTLSDRLPPCQGGRPETWRRLYMFLDPDICEDYTASVASGLRRFDGAAATACLRLVEAATCDTLLPEPSPCDTAFRGTVAGGGACGTNNDCAEGSCQRMPDACGGRCEELPNVGEPCPEQRCARGARCNGGRCEATVRSSAGGACLSSADCAKGVLGSPLVCAGDTITDRTCQPRKTQGACADSFDCRLKYFCDPASHECRPRAASGAPCSPAISDQCEQTTYCLVAAGMTTGTCVDQVAPDGAPCAQGAFSQCAGWCDAPAKGVGVCRPVKKAGVVCTADEQCDSRRCDSVARTCQPPCPR